MFEVTGFGDLAAGLGELICFSLEVDATRLQDLQQFLSPEERDRAARFISPLHRDRFIVARGRLRELLGERSGVEPGRVEFAYGAHGKPEMQGKPGSVLPGFNISHSGGYALLGICAGRAIGVDIEFWRNLRDEEALARRYFSSGEICDYLALPLTQRTAGFFNCWSRKEAYIKALGRGLSMPLPGFQVSLAPEDDARLIAPSIEVPEDSRWCLGALIPFERCSAAVVVEGDICHILPPI